VALLLDGRNSAFRIWITAPFFFASSASLLIGYLTPVAAVLAGLCSLGGVLSLLAQPEQGFLTTRPSAILATAIASALVCLGPGAFSLDARLFGRREIVISNSAPPPDV
jgi:uncharacterized membrane protein YphA (DoxX/SURF4 family)